MSGIYIASKSKHGPRWLALRNLGVPICSTWIDEFEEGATSDWGDLWARCLREASTAAAFIMYVEEGETHKGSLAELGAALLTGVPVYWIGPEIGSVRRARDVTVCDSVQAALQAHRSRRLPMFGAAGGAAGVRDPDAPCAEFEPGTPGGSCSTDGHYMCRECAHGKFCEACGQIEARCECIDCAACGDPIADADVAGDFSVRVHRRCAESLGDLEVEALASEANHE